MKKTYYFNSEGKIIKSHSGEPRKIEAFLKNSESATRIDIADFANYGYFCRHFFKKSDKWVGEIFMSRTGWECEVLIPKATRMHRVFEPIDEEEALSIIAEESERVLPSARESVRWCDPKDSEDKDGRYWLNAYSGAGVYRLIVQNGKILGAIYGGLHDSRCVICSQEAWVLALRKAIEERVQGEYQLLKADGSGTYFYLRNAEDSQYLETKSYQVPSVNGGFHLNVEVK